MENNFKHIKSAKGELLAVIDKNNYKSSSLKATKPAEEYKRDGLVLATMPVALEMMAFYPEVKTELWSDFFDTVSSEFFGMREGKRSYEVLHGSGPLATGKNFRQYLKRGYRENLVEISDPDWNSIGYGEYGENKFPRFHISELFEHTPSSKISIPVGTPFLVYADPTGLDKSRRYFMLAGGNHPSNSTGRSIYRKTEKIWTDRSFANLGSDLPAEDYSRPKGRLIRTDTPDETEFGELERRVAGGRFLAVNVEKLREKKSEMRVYLNILKS